MNQPSLTMTVKGSRLPDALRRPKYEARILEDIKNSPGTWDSLQVGVYKEDVLIGGYVRNYPELFRTFHPFRVGDQWLALYSPDYTCTRLMELPSCRDIGGEALSGKGFCPVEFYVPSFTGFSIDGVGHLAYMEPGDEEEIPDGFASFGLVAGCHWGDDSSWKVQHLDLSKAADGILSRDDRYGYVELPRGVTLAGAVDCVGLADGGYLTLAIAASFRPADGKRLG